MKKKILALYDSEKDYLESLAQFLKTKQELPFALHTYTDAEKLIASVKEEPVEILLVAETDFTYEIAELETGKTLLLNESGTVRDTRIRNIDKYQKAENVYREIMDSYADMLTDEKLPLTKKKKAQLIGFYSPVRRCLQTSFALTLGQFLAEKKKTLYISFEHYAGWNRILDKNVRGDLAALLYFSSEQGEKFFCRMQSMTLKLGQLYYIPPVYAGQNLIYVKAGEWQKLLQKIMETGGYDYIILDISESVQGTFEMLRMCDKVYTIIRDDEQASAKLTQYEELLQAYEYEDILAKTTKKKLPHFTDLPEKIEQFTNGELAVYIRKLIKEELEEA